MRRLGYALPHALWLNVRTMLARPRRLAWMTIAMFAQDMLFFAAWFVFFHAFGTVWGWDVKDIFLLYGINAFSFGLLHFASDGTRDISHCIEEGQLDLYLTRPCHPLLWIKTGRLNSSSLGNTTTGLVFFIFGAKLSLPDFWLAVLVSVLVGTLFEAIQVIYRSIIFFLPKSSSLSEYMVEAIYYLTTVPESGQGRFMQALMFTLVPAAFMVTVPVRLIHHPGWSDLALLAVATVFYCGLADVIFRRGIRRYRRAG
jgi:ABC-2 type transport system permease protein